MNVILKRMPTNQRIQTF